MEKLPDNERGSNGLGSSIWPLTGSAQQESRHFPSGHRIPIMVGFGRVFYNRLLGEIRWLAADRGQRLRLQPAKSRDGGGFGEPAHQTCHSTKRTHRFAVENRRLSIWITMSCAAEERHFSVGSFWKTNPPEGGILVGLGAEMPKNEDSFGCWQGARTLTLWVRVNGILEMLVTRGVTGIVGDASTSSA